MQEHNFEDELEKALEAHAEELKSSPEQRKRIYDLQIEARTSVTEDGVEVIDVDGLEPFIPRPESEVLAAIEELKALGLGACLNGHRPEAQALLDEWLELPMGDHVEPQDLPPMPESVEWLWEQLEPLDQYRPPVVDAEPIKLCPHQWIKDVEALLLKHWGDFEAFEIKETETEADGYIIHRCQPGIAADQGQALLMQWEELDREAGADFDLLMPLWHALECHVDPERTVTNIRRAKFLPKLQPLEPVTEMEPLEQFKARLECQRRFPNIGVRWGEKGDWLQPVEALEHLNEWDKRGRPDNDAPVIRINGEAVQVDVGQMVRNGLEELHQSGVGGVDLTSALLNLAVGTGQPYHSIKKAWDEFCGGVVEQEMFASVLAEMLKGEEPMLSVEELAGADFQKQVIDDFQRQFDCDPMLVLLTVMSAMGTVLPLRTRVRGLSHTQHWRPGVLFVMILVVSGGMKSMLSEELVEKPIVGGHVGWSVKQYAKEARAALSALTKDINKDRAESSPAFDQAHEWIQEWANNGSPDHPAQLMHVVSDFTGEGIDRNAKTNDDFPGYRIGTLLTTDEGRQLMGGDRYKGGGKGSAGSKYTVDKLKRAWDGKGPSSVRGNKALERNYERIRLGILAFIQPEVYDEIASDETDDACGFWPRFLAYESAPVQLREGLTPADRRDIAQNSTFRNYLDELYGAIYSLHLIPLNLGQEVAFCFDEAAEDWWYPIQCQIGRESTRETASGDGVMGRLLGKLPALVVDVSLLLHLLKLKGTGAINTKLLGCSGSTNRDIKALQGKLHEINTIPVETVQAAYKFCRQLMLRTAKQRNRAQGDGSGDRAQFLIKVQATAMKLDPKQEGLPVGKLQKGWSGAYLKKNPDTKDLIYQALGALTDQGLGELTQGTSNNRGGFRYRWLQPVTV